MGLVLHLGRLWGNPQCSKALWMAFLYKWYHTGVRIPLAGALGRVQQDDQLRQNSTSYQLLGTSFYDV